MTNTQPGTILRYIRALAAGERGDEDLLRDFVQHRDDRAFAALVRRHGPLVLRVCLSALRHEQDAEDAFQATFLLLARKAESIKKGQSLASWLHGVAHRLTMQMKRNAGRRRAHEKRVRTMTRQSPCDELSWREVQSLLDEEVGRLPAKCRDVFVLCGLEGVSQSDAARQLGLRESTVSSRLAQARRLLRARLTRRGVSLAGVFGIAALARRAGAAVRPGLVRGTVELVLSQTAARAAATCAAAARIVTLVEGIEQTMSASKLKVVMSFLLALGLAAAGLGGLVDHAPARTAGALAQAASDAPRQGPPQKDNQQPDPPPTATLAKAEGASLAVKGRVLGPDGKPVAGAKLYLGHYGPRDEVSLTRKAETDADGRFEFSFPKSQLSKAHPDQRIGQTFGAWTFERFEPSFWPADEVNPYFTPVGQVMAVAEGLGCDWARIDPAAGGAELTLRLVKDEPVSGRILDEEGKPVAGAKLRLSSVNGYPDEDPKDALAAFRTSHAFLSGAKRWGGPLPGQTRVMTTGQDGRFRMSGLGGNRFVRLWVEGPGIASGLIHVLTRAGDDVRGPDKLEVPDPAGRKKTIDIKPYTVYGAAFRYLAPTARPIRGVVTDKETGKPLAGATVRVQPSHGGNPGGGDVAPGLDIITTRTDREGRYKVLGCAKSPGYDVVVQPADGLHFDVIGLAADAPGVGPLTVDVKLPRGIPVRGKVRDGRTGKPVAGARVHYFALRPNAAARIFNGYTAWDSGAVTGADGSFAVPVLPGPGILIAAAPDATSRAPSAAYAPGRLTDKEWDDFVAKHKLPPDEATKNKHEGIEWVWINTATNAESLIILDHFDSLALLHPDENDKELKHDLVLRPNEGKEKRKILRAKGGAPKEGSEKPKDEPKKDQQP